MKRDVDIAYVAMRKIHYNVMRFKETLSVDEVELLAGRFSSVSGRHYGFSIDIFCNNCSSTMNTLSTLISFSKSIALLPSIKR